MLTLGPPEAEEQLRDAMAIGADRAILLETDGADWDPQATAAAIVEVIQRGEAPSTSSIFGNESADSGGFQVGIRVAHALGRPIATGLKGDRGRGRRACAASRRSARGATSTACRCRPS